MTMKPKLQSTEDLPLVLLKSVFAEPPWVEIVEVEDRQMCFRSVSPPSWMTFVATLQWWQALLGAGLGVVATTVLTEASKDAWKHKARIGKAINSGTVALLDLAKKIVTLQGLGQSHTKVLVGIPMPNEFFPAVMEVKGTTPEEIELKIAQFCLHASGIQTLLEEGRLDPIGSPVMELCDDGDLAIKWMDRKTLEERSVLLSLSDEDTPASS
jgi:hypothetical protein